jgi:hypothetical protein
MDGDGLANKNHGMRKGDEATSITSALIMAVVCLSETLAAQPTSAQCKQLKAGSTLICL